MADFVSPNSSELLAYWQSQRQGSRLPASEDFFDHVPPNLAPSLILFEIIGEALIVRFLGTQLVERWGKDLTGKNWLDFNAQVNPVSLRSNFLMLNQHPCGGTALGGFVTSTGRNLNVETSSYPLGVRANRTPRVICGTFSLEALGYDEHSRGWSPPRTLQWVDVGFGVPAVDPLPP